MIQSEAQTAWREMYQVFNMGHRLEVYLPEQYAADIIQTAKDFNIDAQVIGHVENGVGEKVRIESDYGIFEY